MEVKGIIFDLDGVLCHTDEYHYLAWKAIADELGVPFDGAINNRLRGVSRMDSLEIILENYKGTLSQKEKIDLAERKNNIYCDYLRTMTPDDLEEGAIEVFTALKKRGLKIAVASSSKNANFILQKLKITQYFESICDGNEITHSKPHPEVFLKAAQKLDLPPSDCMVVEDSVAGIEAANAGGFIGISFGHSAKNAKANFYIERLKDLLKIVSIEI